MGYYSPNPHYLSGETNEEAERLESAEKQAGWYFSQATKPQLARYNERMAVASAYRGSPRWERIRADAQREFNEGVKAATALYNETVAEILAHGEVSEALSARWDALDAAPVAQAAE